MPKNGWKCLETEKIENREIEKIEKLRRPEENIRS